MLIYAIFIELPIVFFFREEYLPNIIGGIFCKNLFQSKMATNSLLSYSFYMCIYTNVISSYLLAMLFSFRIYSSIL